MDKEELVDVRIPAPSPDEVSDDDEKVAEDLLLEGKRRDSIPGLKPSPMPGVNLFSRYLTYWWLNPLFSLGSKRPLEAEDFYDLRSQDKTAVLGDQLEREWEKEIYRAKGKGRPPSLPRAILKTFGKGYISLSVFPVITDALRIIQPVFVGLLINFFNQETSTTQEEAFLYALAVCLCSLLSSFLMTPFTFLRQCYGMRVRIACTSLVYNKVNSALRYFYIPDFPLCIFQTKYLCRSSTAYITRFLLVVSPPSS